MLVLACVVILNACESTETDQVHNGEDASIDKTELLALVASGLGGVESLSNLDSFSTEEERVYYLMGQGPESGSGLMKLPSNTTRVMNDLAGERLRIDVTSKFPSRSGGYDKRESSELIIGQSGYLNEDDFLGIGKKKDKPSRSDRTAITVKIERLMNPHILLKEALDNPDLASVATNSDDESFGRRYTEEEVFPVTVDRVRQTGKRTLIVTPEWLQESEGTDFYHHMVEKTQVDGDWLNRVHQHMDIDEAAHHRLVIEDEVYPITLHINRESGLVAKLSTMEWDVVYGDVPLEVVYTDWQDVGGVAFPNRVNLTAAGAPRIDLVRSSISVNPDLDDENFKPPEGIEYTHDEAIASRARYLSQSLIMFGAAGVGRPSIDSVEINPGITLLYAAPADGVYTLIVEQENSIVVIEPGQNDLKGEQVIKWIGEHYPEKPISHLIISHHHNDHGGGIRPYVAVGAKLVVHEDAVDHYRRQASRPPSRILPDALDRNPMELEITGVSAEGSVRLEDSLRTVVIYPLAMGHVTDMVYAFIEGDDVVYAGDLYVSGLARDLRSGTKRAADILPFHAAASLKNGIEAQGLGTPMLVGSHDRQAVSFQVLLDYLDDDG